MSIDLPSWFTKRASGLRAGIPLFRTEVVLIRFEDFYEIVIL